MRHDARRNRERILEAAQEVFGEQGAAGSTEEVARRADVGIATVFRHFPTKETLIEAALIRHFAELTTQAQALAAGPQSGMALRTLVQVMVETGATKITLASLVNQGEELSDEVRAAAGDLRRVVEIVLRNAQEAEFAYPTVTVDELYLLIRGLAQASIAIPGAGNTLHRAIEIILTGIGASERQTPQRAKPTTWLV
ncbi:MAG: TetR/AcrR family transcriptional regulator [Terriglobales bacterium]